MIHGDCFIRNFLFPPLPKKSYENGIILPSHPRVYMIDWQTVVLGCPLYDIASVFDSVKLYFTNYGNLVRVCSFIYLEKFSG